MVVVIESLVDCLIVCRFEAGWLYDMEKKYHAVPSQYIHSVSPQI